MDECDSSLTKHIIQLVREVVRLISEPQGRPHRNRHCADISPPVIVSFKKRNDLQMIVGSRHLDLSFHLVVPRQLHSLSGLWETLLDSMEDYKRPPVVDVGMPYGPTAVVACADDCSPPMDEQQEGAHRGTIASAEYSPELSTAADLEALLNRLAEAEELGKQLTPELKHLTSVASWLDPCMPDGVLDCCLIDSGE